MGHGGRTDNICYQLSAALVMDGETLRTDGRGREEKAQEERDDAGGKRRSFHPKRGMKDKRGRVTIRVRHPSQRRKST